MKKRKLQLEIDNLERDRYLKDLEIYEREYNLRLPHRYLQPPVSCEEQEDVEGPNEEIQEDKSEAAMLP